MKKLILILTITTILFSCSSDSDSNSNNDNNFAENFGNVVNRNFIGQIVNEKVAFFLTKTITKLKSKNYYEKIN